MRKYATISLSFWREADGSIHATARDATTNQKLDGFHVAITNNSARKNGHWSLFRRLDALLKANADA